MLFMIVRFSVSNYRLFYEKATLSMEATRDKVLSETSSPAKNTRTIVEDGHHLRGECLR